MKYSLPREVAGWNAKDVHLKPKQSSSSFTRWSTLTNRTKKSPKWHTCCVQRRSDDWLMFGKAGELILSLILPYFTRHSSASGTTSVTRSREDCRRHEPSRKTWLLCWEEKSLSRSMNCRNCTAQHWLSSLLGLEEHKFWKTKQQTC